MTTTTISSIETADGMMIGRADLGAEAIIGALKERMDHDGLPADEAEMTFAAALAGDRRALDLIRTIEVPAPVARLTMPVQRLTRQRPARKAKFGLAGLMSPLRG